MSKMNIHYVAGLLDGEGSITLGRRHTKDIYRAPAVSISNNYRELLNPLKKQFGGCIRTKQPQKAHHAISYEWLVVRRKALHFLVKVLPHMRHPVKIHRATMIIERYISVTPRNGKYTPKMEEAKLQFEYDFFHEE